MTYVLIVSNNALSQEVISGFDGKDLPVLNDELHSLNSNVVGVKTDLRALSVYFSNGLLGTAHGGTGQDFSTVPANNIPYFSAIGTMGNIGIGTTGQFLGYGSPPAWATVSIPKFVYANRVQATVTTDYSLIGNAATATSSTAITSGGDWTSKNYTVVGEFSAGSGSYTATDSTAVALTSGTTTAVVGAQGNLACETASSGTLNACIRTYAAYSTNPSLSATGSNQNGRSSCTISIVSGNLAVVASGTTCDGSGGQCNKTAYCEFSGTIIREP